MGDVVPSPPASSVCPLKAFQRRGLFIIVCSTCTLIVLFPRPRIKLCYCRPTALNFIGGLTKFNTMVLSYM